MANTYALPQQSSEPVPEGKPAPQEPLETSGTLEALVPSPQPLTQERLILSPPLARLPVELDISVPVREFRVHNLINLQVGQVVDTRWEDTGDLPITARDVQLAWSEFEVIDTQMAVRITRLV